MSFRVSMALTGKRTVTLGELIPSILDATAEDWAKIEVSGISIDSRHIQPGDLFIAVPGMTTDGHRHLAGAARAGAVAAVVERVTGDPLVQVRVGDARRAIAEISHRFFGHPGRRMRVFGITGTNGKTTICAAVERIARTAGRSIGVLGTVGHRIGDEHVPTANTTPEALDLDRLFCRMLDTGITDCVMEVSSHALKLDRVHGILFAGAVFTNLTRDHLDFHPDLDDYRRTKERLFRENLQPNGFAIINTDDPAGEAFVQAAQDATVWRYSISDRAADIRWKTLDESLSGSVGVLFTPVGSLNIRTPLWGAFSFSNLAAAAGLAIALGYPPQAIMEGLAGFSGIRGRAQPIRGDFNFSVFVDYAHTPDALERVLGAARPLVRGRLRVLFGCGGDRDRGKRPQMARAVEQFADTIYLTSDNPRSEDPMRIIADVLEGFADPEAVCVEPDRSRAIERILLECESGDCALLCGKGHETMQLIGADRIEFDDRVVASRFLRERGFAVEDEETSPRS